MMSQGEVGISDFYVTYGLVLIISLIISHGRYFDEFVGTYRLRGRGTSLRKMVNGTTSALVATI